ncbi:hypothetical protein BKA81DRAFT_404925 [Phyllosticta paracitricarpa]|uniref:Uncharacterized protein n=2 Tax=Phyllosticta TaxID=121621 RepID=A0ABR1K797_9PEZI
MSHQNGVLTPPDNPQPDSASATASSPSAAKRKRSLSNHDALPQRDKRPPRAPRSAKALLEDVLDILKSYDTTPSILNHPIPAALDRAVSGEPNSKRAKLAQSAPAPSTIAGKVQSESYASLDDFVRDADAVCSQLSSSISAHHPTSEVDAKLLTGVLAFKKVLKNLVIREALLDPASINNQESADGIAEDDNSATDEVEIKVEPEDESGDTLTGARSVLTLFASTQGNKQLFTSLQKPVKVQKDAAGLDISVDVLLPLDETNFPSMISATKIIPVHTEDAIGGKAKGPTFGEIFGPPPKFRELKPPIPSSQTTTRGNTVVWGPQDPFARMSRRGSTFSSQKLTAGDWLGYGGVDPPKEPTSPSAKRKQRDRALSTGEVNPPVSEEEKAALERAKADALFRSVYSSFAPTHDDGIAVVPEETKNRVWWQKVGERRFQQSFAIDPALAEEQPGDARNGESQSDEDEAFKEAVDSWEPEELNVPEKVERENQDREVEEVLNDINELLESLHSYQRIRYSTLAPSSRTPAAQDAVCPSTPSSEEMDIYNVLKSQLALMVSSLPPYAIAKLNGDQLEDLNISKKLVIKTKDYKGVLEEDQVSKLAKSAAIGAGTVNPAVSGRPSAPVHGYAPSPNHYGRPAPGPQYAGRPVGAPQSYYTPQPSQVRSPSMHQYPPRTGPHYPTAGGYPATAPRPSFPPSYPQQTPARAPSYGAAASAYQTPMPLQYGQRPQSMYGMAPPPGYPPRTQGHGPAFNYTATGSPHVRGGSSPLKQNPLAPTAGGPQTPYGQRPPSASAAYPYATPGAHHQPPQQPGRPNSYYPSTSGVGGGPYSNGQLGSHTPGANMSYQGAMAAYAQSMARHGEQLHQRQAPSQSQRQTSATPQPQQSQGQQGGGPQPVAS